MKPSRSRRRAGVVAVGAAAALTLFGPAGAALAQDCPLTDPTCVVVVQDPIDDVTEVVQDTADTAEGEVATAVDTVETTLNELRDAVDQPPGGDPGDGSTGGDPDDGSTGHEGPGTNHDGGRSASGSRRSVGSAAGLSSQAREGGTLTVIGTAASGRAEPAPADPAPQPPRAGRIAAVAAGIAVSLLIVLGAVLLFMALQARLDRRDPKLALAPVTADVVTFT